MSDVGGASAKSLCLRIRGGSCEVARIGVCGRGRAQSHVISPNWAPSKVSRPPAMSQRQAGPCTTRRGRHFGILRRSSCVRPRSCSGREAQGQARSQQTLLRSRQLCAAPPSSCSSSQWCRARLSATTRLHQPLMAPKCQSHAGSTLLPLPGRGPCAVRAFMPHYPMCFTSQ